MLAPNLRPSLAGHYLSDRVYEGVRHVSEDDAAFNKRAIIRAFRRMLDAIEASDLERTTVTG